MSLEFDWENSWQSKISSSWIEAKLDKAQGILNMKPLQNVKEVQCLTDCIATRGRFMSKLADKCQPLFQVLRKRLYFQWNQKVDDVFQS